MKPASNCYECKRRYPGCHDRCETYKDYRKSIERLDNTADTEYIHYLRGAIKRMTNYQNKGVQA